MKAKNFYLLSVIAVIVCMVQTFRMYSILPDEIPTNIGFDNNITYGSKNFIFVMLACTVLIPLGFAIYEYIVRKLELDQSNLYDSRVIIFAITIFMAYTDLLVLRLVSEVNIEEFLRLFMIGFGILFILIGNYLPRIERSRTIGFRIKATLNDEEVWRKTHRLSGIIFFVYGCLVVLLGIIGVMYYEWIVMISMVVTIIVPFIYANKLAK